MSVIKRAERAERATSKVERVNMPSRAGEVSPCTSTGRLKLLHSWSFLHLRIAFCLILLAQARSELPRRQGST
jgi:hypothetical protein